MLWDQMEIEVNTWKWKKLTEVELLGRAIYSFIQRCDVFQTLHFSSSVGIQVEII